MKNFCVLTDINYMGRARAMVESIEAYMSEAYTIHFLADGDDAYKIITDANYDNVSIYQLSDLREFDKEFDVLVANHVSRPNEITPYHYALASFFTNYLFKKHEIAECLYVDADILFYSDPLDIFKAVENKSVGLVTHKHRPFCRRERDVGYYNVGIIYFRNDNIGSEILEWWKDVVLHPDNPFAPIYNFCGDQKYLELFEEFCGTEPIEVLDYKIGHAAPWNFPMMEFEGPDIIWKDPEGFVLKDKGQLQQKLVFIHFSHFTPNFKDNTYEVDWGGEWGNILYHPSKDVQNVSSYYDDYFEKLKDLQ